METFWEKNLTFVKDIPMIYVKFIITVITVSNKKKKGINLYWPCIPEVLPHEPTVFRALV